jgi:hypothetical protein
MTSFITPRRFIAAIILLFIATAPVQAGGLVETDLDRFTQTSFSDSATLDNAWWTLPAGANFLYFAEEDDECAWNLVQVLDATTDAFGGAYAGTEARIILDREWADEECQYDNFADVAAFLDTEETTYDWYAQDDDGNIWYMGEDTRDSEGESDGSFVAGCDVADLGYDAEAGIVMLGDPQKGDFYQQEFYEEEAEDWGKVLNFIEIDDQLCLKTKEWTPLESGNIEHKFYCTDGSEGVLLLIDELKGKTVTVEYIGSVDPALIPEAPTEEPAPVPECD